MIGTVNKNIFHRLGDALAAFKAAPAAAQLYAPTGNVQTGYLTFPGWPYLERQSGIGLDNNARTASGSPWVYRDISAIAKEASVPTIVVKQRADDGGDTDVDNHPLELLWEAPNAYMGRSWLMQFWIWQLLLYGEAYIYVVPDTAGTPAELWPIPAQWMCPHAHPTKFIDYYEFRRPGMEKPIPIDAKYVTYSRLPNPFDIRRGLAPISAMMVEITGDLAAGRWNANYFSKENATPSGVIAVPKDTLDTDIQRIRMEIQDFFGSGERRVAVARAGDLTWTAFQENHKDMDFLNMRQFTSKLIDTVFGIPEGYWSDKANRANADSAVARMIENAVWPHLVMLAQDINAQIVPVWYGDGLLVEFEDIRPRNRALELQEFTAYQAVRTIDELRAMIGDDEIGDIRGAMLVEEIKKATPIPTTPASLDMEDAIAEMEDEADEESAAMEGAAPEAEEMAVPETPMDAETPTEEMTMDEIPMKALDLERWEKKALKSLKRFKTADTPFASDYIPLPQQERIHAALKAAQTADEVKAAFDDVEGLLASVEGEAIKWVEEATQSDA